MKQPDLKGDLAESLYGFEESEKTDSKVANPPEKLNLFQRPSLIPGVEYPTNDREEHLMDKTWLHAANLVVFHWFDVSEDDFLKYMKKEVERIRKEELKK